MSDSLLGRALARPGDAFRYAIALLKGYLYKVYLPARGRHFTARLIQHLQTLASDRSRVGSGRSIPTR